MFKFILSALIFFIFFSCGSSHTKNNNSKSDSRCRNADMDDMYFYNWSELKQCSISKDSSQRNYFLAGEMYFLKGDDQNAISSFSSALNGNDSNTSLAALYYLKKLDFSIREQNVTIKTDCGGMKEDTSLFGQYILILAKKNCHEKVSLEDFYSFYSLILGSSTPTVLFNIAAAAIEENQNEKALTLLTRIFREFPDSKKAAGLIDRLNERKGRGLDAFFSKYIISEKAAIQISRTKSLMTQNHYEVLYDQGVQKIIDEELMVSRYRMLIRINDQEGVEKFATLDLDGILSDAKIIKKDGSISKDYELSDSESKILFSSLYPGDTIDYSYTVISKKRGSFYGFDSLWLFGVRGILTRGSHLTVFVPENLFVKFSFSEKVVKKEEHRSQNGTFYNFTAEDIFIPDSEAEMFSHYLSYTPHLRFTFLNSWEEFAKKVFAYIKDSSNYFLEINSDVFSDNKNLTAIEKIEFARNYVIDEKDKEADDQIDRAMFLKSLLNQAGIKAYYTFVKTVLSGELDISLPSMQFDSAIVFIPAQDGIEKDFFIDVLSSKDRALSLNPFLFGARALIFDESKNTHLFVTLSNKN